VHVARDTNRRCNEQKRRGISGNESVLIVKYLTVAAIVNLRPACRRRCSVSLQRLASSFIDAIEATLCGGEGEGEGLSTTANY
jgi:hypothetical protein